MKPRQILTTALALFTIAGMPLSSCLAAEVEQLGCEFRENPQGIDIVSPRLSWQTKSNRRGERQTAYQIIAASSMFKLQPGIADLWDTGRVESDRSHLVTYAGKMLKSHQECFWKVRIWDLKGKASGWSPIANWSMGILCPEEWEGHWVGWESADAKTKPKLVDAQWIWVGEPHPEKEASLGTKYFRRTFELPADRKVLKAELALAADDEFACAVNGQHAGAGKGFKTAAILDLKRLLGPGKNAIAGWVKNSGEKPNPAGLMGLLRIEFETGDPLVLATDSEWKMIGNVSDGWTALGCDDSAWPAAKIIGPTGMAPWGEIVLGEDDRRLPARWLRREFNLEKKPVRATVYFSGLGISELYINGQKVGDSVLSPGLTQYSKRALYVAHEVVSLLDRGSNAIGVVLGNGRFYAPRAASPVLTEDYGFPKLILQLRLEFADGSCSNFVTDGNWKLTTGGPILANNEYDGEEYDARKELRGWSKPGFDDANWRPAQVVSKPAEKLSPEMNEPIRVTATLKPLSVRETKPGVFIFDMGQNLVGWTRLKVRGPAGTMVSLRHAERLQADGTLYLENLRGAKVTDRYTLKGAGTETYEPRFTYHGFRYVEVTGFPGKPTLTSIKGRVVNDDLRPAGAFRSSNPVINRTYDNIVWGTRGNYRSIPTDCPQRDERQGWLGDRSAESRGEAYLFDTSAFYSKWLRDIADAQKPNGSIPDVCPSYWPLYNDNVTWPASTVIIPGALLEQYADSGLIARHYPAMVKWVNHMAGFITNGIIERDNYGDWCVPPEDSKLIHSNDPLRKTDPAILATAYFCHCLDLMSRYAKLVGEPADQERFARQSATLKRAFNERFYDKERGYYGNGTQTACVLPLAFDLVPRGKRERVFERLVQKITQETQGHVGTGLIGGQWLNRVLTDGGRADLVHGFATQRTYPSWGYMAEQGATTIWELWNGDTADPAMNSGNHVMLVGDLVIWFYECLAGIKPDPERPGFKHIIMKPHPVGDLQFVRASHRSPYGMIRSEWQRTSGMFRWQVTIPPNTSATLFLPTADPGTVKEGKRPASSVPGVKFLGGAAGRAVFEISSGRYEFTSSL